MSMEHPEKQKNAVKSVVDQVMDGIISQIIDGTCIRRQAAYRMELCKQFGAGRNSVREAVKSCSLRHPVHQACRRHLCERKLQPENAGPDAVQHHPAEEQLAGICGAALRN